MFIRSHCFLISLLPIFSSLVIVRYPWIHFDYELSASVLIGLNSFLGNAAGIGSRGTCSLFYTPFRIQNTFMGDYSVNLKMCWMLLMMNSKRSTETLTRPLTWWKRKLEMNFLLMVCSFWNIYAAIPETRLSTLLDRFHARLCSKPNNDIRHKVNQLALRLSAIDCRSCSIHRYLFVPYILSSIKNRVLASKEYQDNLETLVTSLENSYNSLRTIIMEVDVMERNLIR